MLEVIYKTFLESLVKEAAWTPGAVKRTGKGALIGGGAALAGMAVHQYAPHIHDAIKSVIPGGAKDAVSSGISAGDVLNKRNIIAGAGVGAGAYLGKKSGKYKELVERAETLSKKYHQKAKELNQGGK